MRFGDIHCWVFERNNSLLFIPDGLVNQGSATFAAIFSSRRQVAFIIKVQLMI